MPPDQSWRDRIKVHPAADLFPMMSDVELDELAADIAKNGLRQPIVLWHENGKVTAADEKGWERDIEAGKPPGLLLLLDGRNRLAAIARAFTDPEERQRKLKIAVGDGHMDPTGLVRGPTYMDGREDPVAFVVSANLRRRHLTPGQRHAIITALLKADPARSDRATAKIAHVDHKTVAAVRAKAEDVGTIPHVETRTDSRGRQQPATKPPLRLEVTKTPLMQFEVPQRSSTSSAQATTTAPACHLPDGCRYGGCAAQGRCLGAAHLSTSEAAAVREQRPQVMTQISALLRIDAGKTIDDLVRALRDARRTIEKLPREVRTAHARGILRALGVTEADLQPIG